MAWWVSAGFADFQPHLAAASLTRQGVKATASEIDLPILDVLRDNPSEFRAVNIARMLDEECHWPALLAALRPLALAHDLLIMPACFGLNDAGLYRWLQEQLPCPLRLLPTLPPSVPGIRLHNQLQRRFIRTGGTWLAGDEVTRIGHQEGKVNEIWTRQHGDVPLRPRFAVLASGSFFSNGLIADKARVREPILGLDLQQTTPRENWYQRGFFASQPATLGLKTDTMLRRCSTASRWATCSPSVRYSAVLMPSQLGCGGGVCAVTALHVAKQIHDLAGGTR